MKSIFKKTTGVPAPTDKVGDYNFKDHYPDVNLNLAWSELNPYIRQAIRRYILPFVGPELYDDIADDIQAGTALSTSQTEFVERLRDAAAYCAIMTALPKKKTSIASMGAVEQVAKEGTTSSSLWGFRTTLWSVAQDADRCVDELLEYMEERVRENDTAFTLFEGSDAYNIGKSDLFRTTSEFNEFQNINKSRRTYLALLPILRQVSIRHIVPVLGQEQYDALVAAYKGNSLTSQQSALLTKCRQVAAAWAIYEATHKMVILPDQDGFRVISNADAIDQRAYATDVITSAIERIRSGAEKDARENAAELVAFLADNKEDYPLWADSFANPVNNRDYFVRPFGEDYGAVML